MQRETAGHEDSGSFREEPAAFGLDLSLRSVDYVASRLNDPRAFRIGVAAIHDGAASLIDAIELPSQNSLAGSPPAPNRRHSA